MSSLRQHFQRIKEIVDWSWTLALLCLFGYISLGQLVQLYWAMVCFGGLAASFGLFYEFSCEKLAELNSLDAYQLQKAYTSAAMAQRLLGEFARRNPEVAQQSLFVQARRQVSSTREASYTVFQQRVTEQTQPPAQRPPQSPPRPVQPPPQPPNSSTSPSTTPVQRPSSPPQPPPRPVQPPQWSSRSSPSPPPRPVQTRPTPPRQPPLRRATEQRLSPEDYRRISNQGDYVFVNSYRKRNGTWVNSHYRRRPRR
jgi:hypothetical protein